MLLVTENVGGTSKDMGYLLAFKAILEGIAMLSFPLLLKRMKLETALYIAAAGFFVKQLVTTLAPNVFWLYISQMFQMVSFSFMVPGMVEFVNKYLKKREIIRGISTFSLAMGIGSIVSSLLAGFISDLYGVSSMNMFALVVTVISVIGFCATVAIRKRSSISNQ